MHELSLVESILNIVKDYAAEQRFTKVSAIHLSFGRLSCVAPEALAFAFEVQSRGTPAEGARLEIQTLPGVVHCFSCGRDRALQGSFFEAVCPCCHSREVLLTGGTEELKLISMDVD